MGSWQVRATQDGMKRYTYDIVGKIEVSWASIEEIPTRDFTWSRESKPISEDSDYFSAHVFNKRFLRYNPISSWLITAKFNAALLNISLNNTYIPTSHLSNHPLENVLGIGAWKGRIIITVENSVTSYHRKTAVGYFWNWQNVFIFSRNGQTSWI